MPLPRLARSLRTAATVAVLLAAPAVAQTGPVRNGPLPGPLPLFPADNWWNVDVSQAPVDPASASYIGFIGPTKGMHPDFGGDAETYPEIYGMIYVTVPGTQPLEEFAFDYADESDAGAPGRPVGYPVPAEAKTQPKWIEGGYPGNAGAGGDKHMLIVDRDNRLLFETWNTRYNTGLNRWEAGSGAVFPLDSNLRRPDGWTSADAAGLAILPGLVRYDEAFGADPIEHAIRVTVRATNGYVYPASHQAGSTAGALPMGARLRLKASKVITGFTPEVQRILQAMKTYGLIVADNGSDLYFQGTYDTRWDNGVLNPAFSSVKASDFEVIQLGWTPSAPPPPAGCTPSATAICLNGSRFKVEVTWTNYNTGFTGPGQAGSFLTNGTGYFWFFSSANVELVIKVLDGRGVNGHYWVMYGALSDVGYTITVTDTATGTVRTYTNPPHVLASAADILAF